MAGTMRRVRPLPGSLIDVSMESGLDGRNNSLSRFSECPGSGSLNGVRPRWPEQFVLGVFALVEFLRSQWSPA